MNSKGVKHTDYDLGHWSGLGRHSFCNKSFNHHNKPWSCSVKSCIHLLKKSDRLAVAVSLVMRQRGASPDEGGVCCSNVDIRIHNNVISWQTLGVGEETKVNIGAWRSLVSSPAVSESEETGLVSSHSAEPQCQKFLTSFIADIKSFFRCCKMNHTYDWCELQKAEILASDQRGTTWFRNSFIFFTQFDGSIQKLKYFGGWRVALFWLPLKLCRDLIEKNAFLDNQIPYLMFLWYLIFH